MKSNSVLALSTTFLALIVLSAPLCAQEHTQVAPHTTTSESRKRHTSIPPIARLLGVDVGKDSQERLEHQIGKGLRPTDGHSAGAGASWKTRNPMGKITSDGIFRSEEDEIMEYLEWELCTPDSELPMVRRLPSHAGWLGKIVPSMNEDQVSRLLKTTSLPPPVRSQDTWTWKQQGYVHINAKQEYKTWRAILKFEAGRLTHIEVSCE